MKLSRIFAHLGSRRYIVTRFAPGDYGGAVENGRFRPGPSDTFKVRAMIQPMTGEQLLRLPEGERTRERIVIFTAEQLRTTRQSEVAMADRVAYRGEQFEVESVEAWAGYYRCIGAKVEE